MLESLGLINYAIYSPIIYMNFYRELLIFIASYTRNNILKKIAKRKDIGNLMITFSHPRRPDIAPHSWQL